jgi:hypothetical protein
MDNQVIKSKLSLMGFSVSLEATDHAQDLIAYESIFSDEAYNLISRLTHLKRVGFVRVTGFTDGSLSCLENAKDLEELLLHSVDVTDNGVQHIVKHKALKRLCLEGTRITDNGAIQLSGLTSLRYLFVPAATVSAECAAELTQLLPQLAQQVTRD